MNMHTLNIWAILAAAISAFGIDRIDSKSLCSMAEQRHGDHK